MGAGRAPASSRGHSFLGLAAPALCVAGLLLAPGRACGQFRLFDLGAGTDYLSELQKSLTISFSTGTVTVRDLDDGTTEMTPLDGDPRLLNRKFDIEWSMNGPGVRLPLSLGTRSIGGAEIRPTLTLEALNGDFDLRFLNQRETGPDDALHGRGPMYGMELSVRSEFPGFPWFAEGGYRVHSLPSTHAERSQPFTSQGIRVLSDESRLSRETHDVFSRVGYSFSQDLRSYTGVRYRRANVEIEDDLRFVDTLLQETTLSSRTKLDGNATEAIVGVEARRGSFVGRTEITFNDKDYGVLATVVYKSSERTRREIDEFAMSVASQLAQIEADFRMHRKSLTVVSVSPEGTIYLAAEVALLLDSTEARLLNVLHLKELAPLRASIQFRFRHFRMELGLIPPVVGAGPKTSDARPRIAFAAYGLTEADRERIPYSKMWDQVLDDVDAVLLRATGLARTGNFTLKLCMDSLPRKAKFRLWLPNHKGPEGKTAKPVSAKRGMYYYNLWFTNNRSLQIKCSKPADEPCLDLWDSDGDQLVKCDFATGDCDPSPVQGCPSR